METSATEDRMNLDDCMTAATYHLAEPRPEAIRMMTELRA